MTTPDASRPVSFRQDIAPLFTETDITHMRGMGLDLSKHEDVKARADDILERLKDKKNPMPPKEAGGPWPREKIALFERWIADGNKA